MREQYIFIRESYSNQKTVKMGWVWLNNLDKNRQLLLLLVEEKQTYPVAEIQG